MTSEVMTKKIASEMLQNVLSQIEDHDRQHVFWEAVDMAIEVLKAEDDLIDRVLEIIDKRIEHNMPASILLHSRVVSELNHIKHDILVLKGNRRRLVKTAQNDTMDATARARPIKRS